MYSQCGLARVIRAHEHMITVVVQTHTHLSSLCLCVYKNADPSATSSSTARLSPSERDGLSTLNGVTETRRGREGDCAAQR